MWIALGVAIAVLVGVFVVKALGGGGGARVPFPPGTKAFESFLTLDLLARVIAERTVRKGQESDPAKKAYLEREIAFLSAQVAEHQAIIDAKDVSPGAGSIGFRAYSE